MYETLIAHLRECAKLDPSNNTYKEAADAIEELATIVEGYRKRMWTGSAWIPVGEQLPKDFKKVLVFWTEHSEPMIDTAFWREVFKSFDCTNWEMAGEKITHWMPLPEPPKEK